MNELLKLAALCEQADGPNPDLDHAIHDLFPDGDGAPLYTRSLDAAMSLVPVRRGWRLDFARAQHGQPSIGSAFVIVNGERCHADAATPALALCAASLRALAKEPGHE